MPECDVREHNWSRRDTGTPQLTVVSMKCERCGAQSEMKFQESGDRDTYASVVMSPAPGATALSMETWTLLRGFYVAACTEREKAGRVVHQADPVVRKPGSWWDQLPTGGKVAVAIGGVVLGGLVAYFFLIALFVILVIVGIFYAVINWS